MMYILFLLLLLPSFCVAQSYLGESRFLGLDTASIVELRLMRNEIYARNGHIFSNEQLKRYFKSKGWYQEANETTNPDSFTMNEKKMLLKISTLERDTVAYKQLIKYRYNLFPRPEKVSSLFDDYSQFKPSAFFLAGIEPFSDVNDVIVQLGNPIIATRRKSWAEWSLPDSSVSYWVKYLAYDGLIIKTYGERITSVFCYGSKYTTGDGFSVGMPIGVVQHKYPELAICGPTKGLIIINEPYTDLLIAYENRLITWIEVLKQDDN